MQNHLIDAYARARETEVARVATAHRVIDEWFPPQRATVFSFGDLVGRTLVSLGARFLDEATLVEALEGSSHRPPRAA